MPFQGGPTELLNDTSEKIVFYGFVISKILTIAS